MADAARSITARPDDDDRRLLMPPRRDDPRLKRDRRFVLRRASAAFRMTPSFFILGAMKAGTSSLFDYLCQHPDILPPLRKEVHFFTRGWDAGKGFDWYRAHFPRRARRRRGCLTGEATPGYLYDPEVPRRIARHRPDAKLIVVLRNPVDRAISQYLHETRFGRETLPLEEAMTREDERLARAASAGDAGQETLLHASYKRRGEYAPQISRVLEHFDRDQLLVLTSDELFADPRAATLACFEFLGLPAPQAALRFGIANAAPSRVEIHPVLRARLERHFAPHNRELARLLRRDLPW
jgi:hypothetical protein